MAVGDVYQLKLQGSFMNVSTLNVFYYRAEDGEVGAQDLGETFLVALNDPLMAVTNALWQGEGLQVFNLDDPEDLYVVGNLGTSWQGEVAEQCMPPFVAWSFMYLRGSTAVRNGWKRFAGVSEADVTNGVPTAGALGRLTTLAGALGADLEGTVPETLYTPVIVRLPEPPVVNYQAYPITGVSFRSVSSQNTRKFGRGS